MTLLLGSGTAPQGRGAAVASVQKAQDRPWLSQPEAPTRWQADEQRQQKGRERRRLKERERTLGRVFTTS